MANHAFRKAAEHTRKQVEVMVKGGKYRKTKKFSAFDSEDR
jgi:hypothetical protein